MRRRALLLVLAAALAATGWAAGALAPAEPAAVAAAAAAPAPRFHGGVHHIGPITKARMARSWRPGCPVGLGDLRRVVADHWGFDGRVHRGELVVHRNYARRILAVLHKLFKARYPIQRMKLVDVFGADDDRSMAANNTSGYNCRFVSGTRTWSEHARGRAIDLNPLVNPYVTRSGRVSPPNGRRYANRALRARGMIRDGDVVVRSFAAAGWHWGGRWRSAKDYQHFSPTNR
jgi:hypothetical protein